MGTQLEYSWAEPGDFDDIQSFLVEHYGVDSYQAFPGRCRWLFFENPLGLHLSTCRSAGKLVAVCGHLAQEVQVDGRSLVAGFGIDFMVAKEWRRHGIGRKFLEMRLDRFPLSLSLGQSTEMSGLYKSLSAMDLGPLHQGIHRARPSLSGYPRAMVRDNLAWLKSMSGVRIPAHWPGTAGPMEQAADYAPNPEWFGWRYDSRPYGDYSCRQFQTEGGPSLGVYRDAGDHEVIVDIVCQGVNRPLVLAAMARRSGKPETRILFAGDRLREDCTRAGFWIRPHPARVIAMTADAQLRNQLRPGIFDLMSGASDADLLRRPSGD